MEKNKQKLHGVTNSVHNLSKFRRNTTSSKTDTAENWLTKSQQDALCMLNGLDTTGGEKENSICQEDNLHASSAVLLGSNFGVKNVIRPVKLQEVQKLPPYTTWIFLDRYVTCTCTCLLYVSMSTGCMKAPIFCIFITSLHKM